MMSIVCIYDHSNIDTVKWPESEEGRKAQEYLTPLIKENIQTFISNVTTKMYLIVCNTLFLPIVVNHSEKENSYIASNSYALHFYQEFVSKKHPIFFKLQKPFFKWGEWFLGKMDIDRCIFLNNWLMTNNIPTCAKVEDWKNIIQFLQKQFPNYLIIYRNIDTYLKKELIDQLEKNKFYLLKTRNVFLYDPHRKKELSAKAQSHHRKDRKILEKYGFQIEYQFQKEDIDSMLDLYAKAYIKKHTNYSPHYQKKFLQVALEKKIFRFIGLKRLEKLEGIIGLFIRDQTMITAFFGYDTDVDYSGELYRALTLLILDEAERVNVVLNDSSGGEKAKKYRGLVAYPEYIGIYPHHLAFKKRLFWNILSRIYQNFYK